jgi:nucleoside-diphosphate-sugar epimerase
VLHVASPLGGPGQHPETLIGPARDGTLRVLRAATHAGVKRVVITSSAGAATPPRQQGEYSSDETVWTDATDPNLDAYRKSKVLAERAAWDFMNDYHGPTTLTTILPTAVFGPVLTMANLGSVQFVQRLLDGRASGIPRAGFCVVDVRDVAELHVRAMTAPEAAGQRLIASGDFMWMKEVAATLRAQLGDRAGKVPTRELPNFVVRVASYFMPELRTLRPLLGRNLHFSSAKAHRLLGFSPRPAKATVVECAESLLRGMTDRGR